MKSAGNTLKAATIKKKIVDGYLTVIALISVLIIVSLICLTLVERGYKEIVSCWNQQASAQEVSASHYKWLESLSSSIMHGDEFTGSLDSETCSLGKWVNNYNLHATDDAMVSAALAEIIEPHKEIHAYASDLLLLAQTNQTEAYSGYQNEIKPRVEKITAGLSEISKRYTDISAQKTVTINRVLLFSFAGCIGIGLLTVIFSLFYAARVSKKISQPLVVIAEWSEALSTGIDNLKWEEHQEEQSPIVEVERMTNAFKKMVQGIQSDVAVIQRISAGDMTVFVDIKSEGDLLGQNLYRLVQNNDMMFADLLRVADSVAGNAENIAEASRVQAEQTSTQAIAVESLSTTVAQANELAESNATKARTAAGVTSEILGNVQSGNQKMSSLLRSVDEIKIASEKISGVMKAIDDIAFQTNILALNAAVEAARAGSAGKGFSVVAQEVRNLALKSAEAAKKSNQLIQNTIDKTTEGSKISRETFEMFEHIVGSTNEITEIVHEISTASDHQRVYIDGIHEEIRKITDAVNQNAATSQQTAAATQEMTQNAAVIRQSMHKFSLRKRQQGKAYIPPEKVNDSDFIRLAEENYLRSKQMLTASRK